MFRIHILSDICSIFVDAVVCIAGGADNVDDIDDDITIFGVVIAALVVVAIIVNNGGVCTFVILAMVM